jgi:Sulfatase-modifying factor enzyme 1/Protein of unknown function (DUF1403)
VGRQTRVFRHPALRAPASGSRLSRTTGKTYRLLSEAEWEYVARAGTTTPFWWGSSITSKQANYGGDLTKRTVPVHTFEANPWGLYNVHGNVREWTADCWNGSNQGNPGDGTARTTGDCSQRVIRGGSWLHGPQYLRAASRDGISRARLGHGPPPTKARGRDSCAGSAALAWLGPNRAAGHRHRRRFWSRVPGRRGAETLQIKLDDALRAAIAEVQLAASAQAAPFAAAQAARIVVAQRPDAEILALWLADAVLAARLKWPRPLLTAVAYFQPVTRARLSIHFGNVRP